MEYSVLLSPTYDERRRELPDVIEGVRSRPYIDSKGWITIGVSFNLGPMSNADNRDHFLQDYLGLLLECSWLPSGLKRTAEYSSSAIARQIAGVKA